MVGIQHHQIGFKNGKIKLKNSTQLCGLWDLVLCNLFI
jgi:hypothetical protein